MSKITYTFPADCPIAQLRGRTFTGGEFCRADGQLRLEPDAVRFGERVDGKAVLARIAGTPALEAALIAHKTEALAIEGRLAAIGWPQYSAIQRRAINAEGHYDAASERGYPAREAEAMKVAYAALDQARAQYPLAAAYAKTHSYSMAAHYQKASAGRKAMRAIEAGGDVLAVIAAMESEWSAAAEKAVRNA